MKQIKAKQGLEHLHSGDFNSMSQYRLPDNTLAIRLQKRKTKQIFLLWVKDYGKPTEKLIKGDIPWPQTLE